MSEKSSSLLYIRGDPVEQLRWGGAYAHTAGVIKGFVKNGFDVTFVGYLDLPLEEGVKKILLSPPRVPTAFFKRLFSGLTPTGNILSRVKEHPRFVYYRLVLNDLLPYRISRKLEVPLVMEYNGSEVWIAKKWSGSRNPLLFVSDVIERFLIKHADAIVTVSRALAEDLYARGADPEKVLVNPNGFDEDLFSKEVNKEEVRKKWGIMLDMIMVVHVSSFAHFHGAHVLAQTAKEVLKENKDICFVFVGDGEKKKEVEKILEDAPPGKVVFTGRVKAEEAMEIMKSADILVASHVYPWEGEFFGSPTKLFEYMASGGAVIASAIGQMKEIIMDGENGVLVPQGDVVALKNAIMELAEDKEKRIRLAENARKEVFEKYTWTAHVRRIIGFLRERRLL